MKGNDHSIKHVVLALLKASKQLQAAVAEGVQGQVPAVMHVRHLQHAICSAQRWPAMAAQPQRPAEGAGGTAWESTA